MKRNRQSPTVVYLYSPPRHSESLDSILPEEESKALKVADSAYSFGMNQNTVVSHSICASQQHIRQVSAPPIDDFVDLTVSTTD